MTGRNVFLATGEYYHVFNRGISRQPIFLTKRDYDRLLLTLSYYKFDDLPMKLSRLLDLSKDKREKILKFKQKPIEKLVEIICFVLMPNHFHLLIKQIKDNGISKFMNNTANSYTRYFNIRNQRVGDLFQGVFKAVHIESEEQLLHLSRYIHLNPFASSLIKKTEIESFPWSSFPDFIKGSSNNVFVDPILSYFKSSQEYKKFVLDHADYAKKLEQIKHLVLE